METKFILSCVVLSATVLTAVIARTIPDQTFTEFDRFMDVQDEENACPFPPGILLDKEKMKPCLETERTGSLVQICDGIVQISNDVCAMTNCLIPAPKLFSSLQNLTKYDVGQICAELDKRTVFGENDTCLDVCAEGRNNHICKLNVALYQTLYTYFRGLKNHSDVHHVIHRLARYFPFPPHGTMDQGNFLEACAKEGQTNVTNLLCSAIKELAARSGEQNSKALTFHDVMSNVTIEWSPCPAINGSLNISNSFCENNCKDGPNNKICRSIALGLIHLKLSGNPDGTTVTTTQKPNIGGNQGNKPPDLGGTKISSVESASTLTNKSELKQSIKPDTPISEKIPAANTNKNYSNNMSDNPVMAGDNAGNQVTIGNNPINASSVKTDDPTPPSDMATVTKTSKPKLDDELKLKTPKLSPNDTTTIETSTNDTLQSESPSSTTPVNQNSEGDVSLLKPTAEGQGLLSPSELDVNDGTSKEVESKQPDTDQDIQPTPFGPETDEEDKYINSDPDDESSMDNVVDAKMDNEQKDTNITTKPGNDSDSNKTANENPNEDKKKVYSDLDDDMNHGGIGCVSYFLVFLVLCVTCYILINYKEKIIVQLVKEKSAFSGRRPSSKEYEQLKTDYYVY